MEPLSATAELRAGEAMEVLPRAQERIVGGNRFLFWYQGAGLLAGLLVGGILAVLLPLLLQAIGIEADMRDDWVIAVTSLVQLLAAVIGFALGFNAGVRRHARKFLEGMRQRGTPPTITFRYTIEYDGLSISSRRISHHLAWQAIQEIIPAPEHWLIQVDTLSLLLPRRAFADEAAEREFLAEILEFIEPAARERSSEAVAFASLPEASPSSSRSA